MNVLVPELSDERYHLKSKAAVIALGTQMCQWMGNRSDQPILTTYRHLMVQRRRARGIERDEGHKIWT